VSAVRAWLALNRDKPEVALTFLESPREAGYQLSWYHSLRADCHLALGQDDAAADDYTAMLEETRAGDGTEKCQLALASALLHKLDTAERWLKAAAEDPTTRPTDYRVAEACVALARGDLELGLESLRMAIAATTVPYRLDVMTRRFPPRVRLLTDDPASRVAWEAAIRGVLDEEGNRRRRLFEQRPPNADSELEALLDQHDDGAAGSNLQAPATALLAIHSRRQSANGEYSPAADGYARLRGSRFEPEAGIALTRNLELASDECAADGRVEDVERIQQRLIEAGAGNPIGAGLAVVSALQAAERTDEARERLEALLEQSEGDDTRELHRRLGDLLAADGEFDGAYEHFASALESARESRDWSNVAQLESRLAVVGFAAGDTERAKRHVVLALDAWREAGVFEPVWTLMQDLGAAAASVAFLGLSAAKALAESLDSLRREGELAELTDSDLASLEEDLTSAVQQPQPAANSGATALVSGLTSLVSRLGSARRGRGSA
jgi:tetratricopeptide (TPR) repeat protein